MKAMVYHGANDIRFEEKPRPQIIDPTDAVVKIIKPRFAVPTWVFGKAKTPKSLTAVFSAMKASVL